MNKLLKVQVTVTRIVIVGPDYDIDNDYPLIDYVLRKEVSSPGSMAYSINVAPDLVNLPETDLNNV